MIRIGHFDVVMFTPELNFLTSYPMDSSRPHKQLEVWSLSVDFVKKIYRLTSEYPSEEKYGLTSQLRRAAVSVPTNIAEGAARDSEREFKRFLHMSSGSLSELDTLLVLSSELGILSEDTLNRFLTVVDKLSAMLSGLISHLEE